MAVVLGAALWQVQLPEAAAAGSETRQADIWYMQRCAGQVERSNRGSQWAHAL